MNRPTVLIVATDSAFSREITANWPRDHGSPLSGPEFIVLDEAFCCGIEGSHYDLAIAEALPRRIGKKKKDRRTLNKAPLPGDLEQSLAAAGRPVIMIHSHGAHDFYDIHFYDIQGAVIALRREPGIWASMAGLLGREILRRSQSEGRARESERICAGALAEATLGRYMVEMRTNINNALTTVLGNAELLSLEPGLPAGVQAKADAIRNMALRIHEVFQRFSSIEKDLTVGNRDSTLGQKALPTTAGGH
jgi:hypothetical protein